MGTDRRYKALPHAKDLFGRHHDVAVLEPDAGSRSKPKRRSPGAEFLNRKIDHPIAELKGQGERYFAELRIHLLDPTLEIVGRERSHVAHQDGV